MKLYDFFSVLFLKFVVIGCVGIYLYKYFGIYWIGILVDNVSVYFFWDIFWNICIFCYEYYVIVLVFGWLVW